MSIYLDNASTTFLDPQVFEAMKPFMVSHHGNPSSIHAAGREVKSAIETARKKIASMLNVSPLEIYFTSGGTEADNTFISGAIHSHGIKHVISSPLEHHAVLHTLEYLEKNGRAKVHYLQPDVRGNISLEELDRLLEQHPNSLVSLMHGNNEIGNLLDLKATGEICECHKAIFHSDTVQTVGHFQIDLSEINVTSIAASAHKFHGPKGVGFMYIDSDYRIDSYIHGGSQERSMRAGTENVYGIVGLASALEMAIKNMDTDRRHILNLKHRMISRLKENIPGVDFNGMCSEDEQSLYTVLNVRLPESPNNDMLLFQLDLEGICASGGSACTSGATTGSHVIAGLGKNDVSGTVRFSFSKFNKEEDIDRACDVLEEFYSVKS